MQQCFSNFFSVVIFFDKQNCLGNPLAQYKKVWKTSHYIKSNEKKVTN